MSVPAARQQPLLTDLPHAAVRTILHTAGLRSRELCKALQHLYGPLPRLAPRGLESLDSLLSAVVANARHTHLQVLDLTHVGVPVTGDDLLALCKRLPNLRALHLPSLPQPQDKLTLVSVAAATSHLPALEALHVPCLSDMDDAPLPEWPFGGWSRLRELALPRPLVVAPSSATFSSLTTLSRLCTLGAGDLNLAHVASIVAQLPALVALEQQSGWPSTFESVGQLRGLTQLTALQLTGMVAEEGRSTSELLLHVGALTHLRSLHLKLWWPGDMAVATPGWLGQLTRLSRLRVDFGTSEEEGGVFDDVAASVPHLPALCELHIADTYNMGAQLSAAACALIASASGGLRLLSLGGLSLPASMFSEVLPQLTGLRCLCLNSVYHSDAAADLRRLAVLTSLRELGYVGNLVDTPAGDLLPCHVLAGLSNVTTLTLAQCPFVDASYLGQLCASMQQLRRLDLRDSHGVGAGACALQLLTRLEVLGLQRSAAVTDEVWKHVAPPPSLARCYLGSYLAPEQKEAMALPFLERHVQVVFESWPHAWQGWRVWHH